MEPDYKEALRIVAQALAWHCFGECRSFGEDVPLLKPAEANTYAKFVLDMGGSDTTNERKYSGRLQELLQQEECTANFGLDSD